MRVLRLTVIMILGVELLYSAEVERLATKPFAPEMRFIVVNGIAKDPSGALYVVDRGNHRVIVLSPVGKFLRQIGGAGQGPEDLMWPKSIAINDDGGIVAVLDSGNNRVQIFSPEGKGLSHFPLHTPKVRASSIALGKAGTILLNEPSRGKLVSVYSREGKELRAFGDLLPSSVGYPGKPSDKFPQHLLNLAHLLTDSDGSVWVVFRFMPIVQRYSPEGRLEWQVRLSGPGVESMSKTFWGEPGAPRSSIGVGLDGYMLATFVTGATLTSRGNVALTLGLPYIIVLNPSGREMKTSTLEPTTGVRGITTALVENEGILILGKPKALAQTVAKIDF